MANSDRRGDELLHTVDRALSLLEAFRGADDERTQSELCQITGLERTIVHRLLRTLAAHQFVQKDLETRRYRLGSGLTRLFGWEYDVNRLIEAARPEMVRIGDILGETIRLSLRRGLERVVVDEYESNSVLRAHFEGPRRNALTLGPTGHVILAFLPPSERGRIISQLSAEDPLGAEALAAILSKIVSDGFAMSQGQNHDGLLFVSAPLFDARNFAIGALSVAGPESRFTAERQHEAVLLMLDACRRIRAQLLSQASLV